MGWPYEMGMILQVAKVAPKNMLEAGKDDVSTLDEESTLRNETEMWMAVSYWFARMEVHIYIYCIYNLMILVFCLDRLLKISDDGGELHQEPARKP